MSALAEDRFDDGAPEHDGDSADGAASLAGDGRDAAVEIVISPSGPMLVRGPVALVGADGEPLPRRRGTVALCRCGKTSIAPYCDGTHKLIRRFRPEAN